MGNRSSLFLREDDIIELQEETGFTPNQIERLYSRFLSLDRSDQGALTREDLLRIPEIAINPLGIRIVDLFFASSHNQGLNFRQFLQVLSHFRSLGRNTKIVANSVEDKLRYAFDLYDLDNDNMISRSDLYAIIQMMVGENISKDQLIEIVTRTIPSVESSDNPKIPFETFCTILKNSDVENRMSIHFLN